MRTMKQHKPTFNQILTGLEKDNSEKLMSKARLANRLAKQHHGHRRQLAYQVKAKALSSLVHQLPNQVNIRKDIRLEAFVVVELKTTQSGLHFPVINL